MVCCGANVQVPCARGNSDSLLDSGKHCPSVLKSARCIIVLGSWVGSWCMPVTTGLLATFDTHSSLR
ncbi:hypothetical protein PAXRUDRAFT_238199 [Paxillus rubicundulus Ve08.2h10]|uniref:Uncharacterized protein n=1 Tax=Paxillus rubicundulus Ve08.2h10 TaxID=930991 RepID=A0A0D0EBB1_9AGAM|nr:hypothetical protein PAXRUDRAFT_238199 [Paxillus rubicundulus Ve08.2h10]